MRAARPWLSYESPTLLSYLRLSCLYCTLSVDRAPPIRAIGLLFYHYY